MAYRHVVYRNPQQGAVPPSPERAAIQGRTNTQDKAKSSPCMSYGAFFQRGPQSLLISVPGGITPVSFSDNAMLIGGIMHNAGAAEILVNAAGVFEIEFALHIISKTEALATFMLQADGAAIAGGLWDTPLRIGYQSITGFAIAKLNARSRVRVAMTSASPLGIALTGAGTGASLFIKKIIDIKNINFVE